MSIALIELLVVGCVYSCYGSIMLAVADRVQPRYCGSWWAVMLGPIALCYLAASLYSLWRRRRGMAAGSTFLEATMLIVGLELLLIPVGIVWLAWFLLRPTDPG